MESTSVDLSKTVCMRFPAVDDCIVEKTVSDSTTKLTVYNMRIYGINLNTFTAFTNLQFLDFECNSITTIQPGAFNQCDRLHELRISNNTGRLNLQPGTFDGLSALQILRMCNCNITQISVGAFDALTSLQELYLSSSNIHHILVGTFDKLYQLRLLGLDSNPIKQVDAKLFRNNRQLRSLYINIPSNFVQKILYEKFDLREQLYRLVELAIGLRSKDLPVLVILEILSHLGPVDLEFMWRVTKLIKQFN